MGMSIDPKREQLALILHTLIKNLQKEGLLPEMDSDETNKLVREVVNQVVHQISDLDAVKDKQFINALSVSLISTFVAEHNPMFRENFSTLFPHGFRDFFDKNLSPADQKLELKNHFILLLTALNESINRPELRLQPNQIKQQAEELTEVCLQKNDKDSLAESQQVNQTMALLLNDLLVETLSNLNAGVDTRTGLFVKPVLIEKGNLIGAADPNAENAGTSKAFLDIISSKENVALGVDNGLPHLLENAVVSTLQLLDEIGLSIAPKLDREH